MGFSVTMNSRYRAIPSYEPLVRNPLIFVVPAQAGTHIAFGNPVVWEEMGPRLRGDGEILTRRRLLSGHHSFVPA